MLKLATEIMRFDLYIVARFIGALSRPGRQNMPELKMTDQEFTLGKRRTTNRRRVSQ